MNNQNSEFNNVHKNIIDKLPENVAMITKVWGPPTWFFLHSMAMSYPKKINEQNAEHRRRRSAMFAFLSNLGDILPCPLCGVSYNSYIRDPSLSIWEHLHSRGSLIEFIYKIHNRVNIKLGVPQCNIPSFKEVVEFYKQFIANGPCKATTDEERENRLLLGCTNEDIKEGKFKNFSCSVNVVNKNNNSGVSIKKENMKNIENLQDSNSNGKGNQSCDYTWTIIFAILTLVFMIISIILFIKINK